MFHSRTRSMLLKLGLAAAGLVLAHQAGAQVMSSGESDLHSLSLESARFARSADIAPVEDARHALRLESDLAFDAFARDAGGEWRGHVDLRTGYFANLEGAGIPWIAGAGNGLAAGDQPVGLAELDARARALAPRLAGLLGIEPKTLVLNAGRSGHPAPHLWFVDYDVVLGGLRLEGARVVFAVNSGNLVSVGTENLPAAGTRAPERRVGVDRALAALAEHLGGISLEMSWIDPGSYHLLPANRLDLRFDEGYEPGRGRGIAGVWEFVFRRPGTVGTFRARVDATSGELAELLDVNEYGSVTGGVYQGDRPSPEVVLPMPFANVATGVYANSAGVFSGTTGTTTLTGQYVRIVDSCGSISKSADGSGLIAMGSSGGTDCTTPGTGGSGNTHSARTQFYALNRAKEVARGWLPSNSWLNAQLRANVNLNQTCNAYWNGSTVNFFRSGGGCANTGELPGVSLHEYGHGFDSNDGSGSSPDNGTGETYGDFTAALATHDSCIGNGFLGSSNCGGYGNSCTSCSGVRDIDWAQHTRNTASTVANFTQTTCPQPSPNNPNYIGPCGADAVARGQTSKKREGHCESYVSSEALWDLAARDLPSPGSGAAWATTDRLWYLSRSSASAAFSCNVSGSTWTSNGCNTGSLFKIFRVVDDDDGNLANGTPHGGAIASAFNRHGIACTTDTGWNVTHVGVTPPATPALTVTAGNNSASLSWSGSSGVYDVYRNESGCNAGFTRVANDVSGSGTTDSAVANGFTYYYQVVAHPSGTEAAASAPSTCRSVTPSGGGCTPPAAPTGVSASATSQTAITVSWSAASGATSYKVYRSTTSGGPYAQVGTSTTTSFADSGLTCNTTYYYVVRSSNGSCDSGDSAQASATTQACSGGTTATFDATLQAPKCGAVVNSCDTGAALVLGRAGLGPEPNQPNTINDSCADGTSGSFHSDESNDRLKVYTLDGTDFAPGKQVRVEATVWAWSGFSSDHLDLYYAADATSPSWTLIGTVNPTAAGAQVLSATYTLPTGGSLQAVRAAFRYNGSASSCASGSYNDRDDLVFAVGGGGDTTPPTTAITSPANGATVSGTVNVTASASDNVGVTSVQFFVDGALASTDTSSPYSFSWDTTAVSNGSHSLFSRAFDAAGNMGTSATVNVTVSNPVPDTTPPTTSITSPANGATVSGTVNVTASASDNVGVTSVQFFVDGALASTDTSSPYSFSWDTTAVSDGSHSLFSRAFDAAGNSGTSSTISVTVDNSTGGDVLQNGVPVTGISGASGSEQFWTMAVPSGATNLVFQISGGSGDADLYVRFGAAPTTATYDCRPWLNGNNETCSFAAPSAGTWHVMLHGYNAYSGVTLVGSFDEPTGGCTTATLYSNNFDSASGLSDWTRGTFVSGGSTTSWRGVQTCTAASGSRIFRYGGSTCTANYSSNNFNFAVPSGASGISVPAGSTDASLSFKHRRGYESGYDGGTLAVSLDGSNYFWVDASALTGAAYNGTIAASCPPSGTAGRAVFTGVSSSFSTTTVDLDAVCDSITGGSGGCAGQTLRVAFVSITDCSVTNDGWFLDDVQLTACTP